MHKIYNFSKSVPLSVRETIAHDAPTIGSSYETSHGWLTNFGTSTYRKSFFYKGPLIYLDPKTTVLITPVTTISINAYKTNVKRVLLNLQSAGESGEWQPDNFLLYNIRGLRQSSRLNN